MKREVKKRPQWMRIEDYLNWVKENELEVIPEDWEKDCWEAREGIGRVREVRPTAYWEGGGLLMAQLTYMSLHKLQKNPFSQSLHAAHTCSNSWCVNPYHIIPKTASENEKDKRSLPGWDIYRENQRQHQLEVRKQGKIMPQGLSHIEKAKWILETCTYLDNKGCMIYTGQKNEQGYGRRAITVSPGRRKKVEIHRYIHCMLNGLPYGEDPNDPWNAKGKGFKVADHTCNEPSCVNPDHIELISRSLNTQRATATSRATKITEENAREIIEAYLEVDEWPLGSKIEFARKYAKKFKVSTDVTQNIVFRKRNWKPLLKEYGLID